MTIKLQDGNEYKDDDKKNNLLGKVVEWQLVNVL